MFIAAGFCVASCRLDKANDRFSLRGGGFWGFKREERRLSDLAEATVSTAGKGGSAMCRIVFKFVSGKSIPLTYYQYPDSQRMRKAVKEINDFLGR